MKKLSGLLTTSLVLSCLLCASTLAQVIEMDERKVHLKKRYFKAGMKEIGISGGYGYASEDEIVTDFFLAPKLGLILADFDGMIPGALEVDFELMAGMYNRPETAQEASFNLLFTYNFETGTQFVPFLSAGAGAYWTNLNVNELGSRWNGAPQGGLGVKYFINDTTNLSVMGRIRHISNAGTASPNRGLDSGQILLGINFLR
ncbi:MAG: acyloxyacyl hydrolase [Candidatus Bathyanammoxibius sp.]